MYFVGCFIISSNVGSQDLIVITPHLFVFSTLPTIMRPQNEFISRWCCLNDKIMNKNFAVAFLSQVYRHVMKMKAIRLRWSELKSEMLVWKVHHFPLLGTDSWTTPMYHCEKWVSFSMYLSCHKQRSQRPQPLPKPGLVLASAGPDWKHFCGAQLSGVEKFLKGWIKS